MKSKKPCQVKNTEILDVEDFLRAIHNKHRLRILCAVKQNKLSVGEIQEKLRLPQNMVSHHIAILKKRNLLVEERDRQFRRYMANEHVLRKNILNLDKIVGN